jgi:hypothetical protein
VICFYEHTFMKSLKKNTSILLILIFINSSCLEQVEVGIRQQNEQLVVEGLLTNFAQDNYLRLSYTTQYAYDNEIIPARGVLVEVRRDNGEKTIFRPVPDELGVYKPDEKFVGVVGASYSIYLKLPDEREFISAPEKMVQPVPIQNISAEFEKNPRYGFRVFVDFQDSKELGNYYRWDASGYHIRRTRTSDNRYNRCYVLKTETNVNIISDANINGNIVKAKAVFFSPFYATGRHFIEIKQRSISRNAFLFWQNYQKQASRSGTIFDPLPAQLAGNIKNTKNPNDIALGYFEVASTSSQKHTIAKGDSLYAIDYYFNNEYYIPQGDCMIVFPFSIYADRIPTGW